MPWEKSFDLEDATDRAIAVFWAKGFQATSISDLTEGMRINKGSLYNAFGSKKELFTRALHQYVRCNLQQLLMEMNEIEDPVFAMTELFDRLVAQCIADADRRGCFLVNTALDLPNHQSDVSEFVSAAMSEIEAFFRKMLRIGQSRGQIPEDVDADERAKALLSLSIGLRVLSRGVFDASSLHAVRNQAVRLLAA
jgi:TetR/AcrR family transcriptional repressor of nem operon